MLDLFIFRFGDDLPGGEFGEAIELLAVCGIPEFAIVRIEAVVAEECGSIKIRLRREAVSQFRDIVTIDCHARSTRPFWCCR